MKKLLLVITVVLAVAVISLLYVRGNLWDKVGVLPVKLSRAALAVVGNQIYLFGGINRAQEVNTIYRAPTSDPAHFVDTGAVLPDSLVPDDIIVAGDYIYLFGGLTSLRDAKRTEVIYRAPISNPTSWSRTNSNVPVDLSQHVQYLSNGVPTYYKNGDPYPPPYEIESIKSVYYGNNIYLFETLNIAGDRNTTVYRASVSDPMNFINIGVKGLPMHEYITNHVLVIGDYVYVYGSYHSLQSNGITSAIYRAPISDPINFTNTGTTFPGDFVPEKIAITRDHIFGFGGYSLSSGASMAISSAPVSNPAIWTETKNNLPKNILYPNHLVTIGEYVYIFGGDDQWEYPQNIIYRAKICDLGSCK